MRKKTWERKEIVTGACNHHQGQQNCREVVWEESWALAWWRAGHWFGSNEHPLKQGWHMVWTVDGFVDLNCWSFVPWSIAHNRWEAPFERLWKPSGWPGAQQDKQSECSHDRVGSKWVQNSVPKHKGGYAHLQAVCMLENVGIWSETHKRAGNNGTNTSWEVCHREGCYTRRWSYVVINDTYSEGGTHEETLHPQSKARVMNKNGEMSTGWAGI